MRAAVVIVASALSGILCHAVSDWHGGHAYIVGSIAGAVVVLLGVLSGRE